MRRAVQTAVDEGIGVAVETGIPDAIDAVAARADATHGFLRAAWYRAAMPEGVKTIVARRGDGRAVAAIPTAPIGPPLLRARGVPGSYWPFRSIALDPTASDADLIALFANPVTIATLGPAWRLGPVYGDDATTVRIKQAVAAAGWTVLTRELGNCFQFDASDAGGWPRRSTRRRLGNYGTQLGQLGDVEIALVRGGDWSGAVLDQLGRIEAASWVGTATDGSGAKFLTLQKREGWAVALADPVLADALSATILSVGGEPAAFSFDLRCGETQYSIASSFDARFAAYRPGKLVTAWQVDHARASGVTMIDLGAGDSGYKREMGAVPGGRIVDLLIVRNRPAAALARLRWGGESRIAREAYLTASKLRDAGRARDRRRIDALLAFAALAAAALSLTE